MKATSLQVIVLHLQSQFSVPPSLILSRIAHFPAPSLTPPLLSSHPPLSLSPSGVPLLTRPG